MDNKIIPTDSEIPMDSEIETFSDYLNNNCRGILSARFGDGKSFFLNKVKQKLSNQYVFLTIYPINYQVAENKDIFEYIKRDILLQILMTSKINLSDEKYDFALRLWGFLNQNGKGIVSDIVSLMATTLANIPQNAIKVFQENIIQFKKFSKEINNSQSDSIESYLDEFVNQKGGIYEFDPISQIIYQLITDIKAHDKKQVVLIIEDMDRIDPAHIFRILNIFSAHWDIKDYSPQKLENGNPQNKYNLDKILMVCHFQNIKNIFHHLYGEKTDFTGYIHKFSPETPYEYSLRDVIENWIFERIPLDKEAYPDICRQLTNLVIQKYDDNDNIITNIRHLAQNLNRNYFKIRNEYIEFGTEPYVISSTNNVTKLLCFLKDFGISIDEFLDSLTLKSFDNDKNHHYQIQLLISECWLIFPNINMGKNSINKRIRFSFATDNQIYCKYSNYSTLITIHGKHIENKKRWYFQKLLIENMSFVETSRFNVNTIEFKERINSKANYKAILSFFQQFIY